MFGFHAWRRWLMASVIALLSLHPVATATASDEARFTILHTNDLHGRLLPFPYAEKSIGTEAVERGGAARRAALIHRLRRQIPNAAILVDAGDIFTRGALTNAYEGLADVAAMNATGYEMAAVGNNEFKAKDAVDAEDWAGSQAALLRVVKKSRFPWLCANLTDSRGQPIPGIRPYVVRKIAGLRVAFLSVTAPRSAGYSQTRGWTIGDPIEAARTWVPRLRPRCDVLIALTHIGYALDQRLAQTVPGIDAIVGGDSHTFLHEATWVDGPRGVRVPIVQAGEYGVNVGRFDLRFVKDGDRWRLADARAELVPVTAELEPNREVEKAVAPYVRPFLNVIAMLDRAGADAEEKARITTEVVVQALLHDTGADMAMNPAGGGLVDVFHSQRIRRYDVYAAMPFRNRAVTVLLSGDEIERLLESRPTMVRAGLTTLEPARVYRVAMVDYVAAGIGVAPVRMVPTGRDVREVVEAYLRQRSVRKAANTEQAQHRWSCRASVSAAPALAD